MAKYKKFLAHFDILGYGTRIKNKSIEEELGIQRRFLDDINKLIRNTKEVIKCDTISFSDTHILYSDDFSRIIRGALLFMLMAVCRKTPYFPMRGAITYDDFLFDKEKMIVIGRALREAYILSEQQEWMGCCLSESCDTAVTPTIFNYYTKKGVLVKYNVPIKNGKLIERYVINMESFSRVWGTATRDMKINDDFVKNIFVDKGLNGIGVIDLDKDAQEKLKNTQEFFRYIEKIKVSFE